MLAKDFFRARAEVAMVTQNRREFVRIFAGDLSDGAKEQGEADGQDAFFAAREDSAAEIQRAYGGFLNRSAAQILGNEADFLGFFGGGGDGFAELTETEHG